MRRHLIAAAVTALIAGPAPVVVAQTDPGPPAGVGVERVTLAPGDRAAFTLARGFDHQLLIATDPAHPAPHAIVIAYTLADGGSDITVTSATGYPTTCSVLADPRGTGGYSPAGDITTPGDGTPVTRHWPAPLGAVNIGNFIGGPQGGLAHAPG